MSAIAMHLTATTLILLCTVGGCRSSGGAYRSTDVAAPATDRFGVRITVQGVSQIRWMTATRVEDVLNRVPGLTAIATGTDNLALRIRGRESPSVLIDGVPALAADILLLYPWEIAEVEVLRDVASTAVYGTRGASGIVKITTRRTRQLIP